MPVVAPVVAVVVLAVPMSFVQLPAFAIVVVMRMGPVCAFKRRTLPVSPDPPVMAPSWRPISFHPNEARAREAAQALHKRRPVAGCRYTPKLVLNLGRR